MEAIKQELNSEEKFFESAIRTERFVKRYQKPLIAVTLSALISVFGIVGYQKYEDVRIERANEAFNLLLKNPRDSEADQVLKNNNPKLHDLWKLSQALANKDLSTLETLKSSESFGVADIAQYESAVIKNDLKGIEGYSKRQGGVYKDLALVELAVDALEKGNSTLAKQKLAQISKESSLYPMTETLLHYGAK